jgi:hypothetical protein
MDSQQFQVSGLPPEMVVVIENAAVVYSKNKLDWEKDNIHNHLK